MIVRSHGMAVPELLQESSQTSLDVGNAGTACQSCSIVTSPVIAIVAEWGPGLTSGRARSTRDRRATHPPNHR